MEKMDKVVLEAKKRSIRGKKNQTLRTTGLVPAVVYGRGVKSEPLEVDSKAMERAYHHAGGSKIVSLKVDEGKARNVLIHDVQRGSARGELLHVDFYVVRMDEELKAEVPLHYVGESTAVYQLEGTLVKNLDVVEVECLPGDLPDSIEVDISVLDDFEKTITLAELKVATGVKIVAEDLTTLVAKVDPPRSDEEMAELEEEVVETVPESAQEEDPVVVSEENEGDKDRRDKK
jgi:large subunit ribosomal protein L25